MCYNIYNLKFIGETNMDWQKGYYTDDLKVYINYIEKPFFNPNSYQTYRYRIFIMLQGKARIFYNNKEIKLKEYQMIFTDNNISYGYSFSEDKPAKYLELIIHPSVFNNTFDDEHFLRSLIKTPDDKRVIDINSDKFISLRQIIDDIIKCLDRDSGRAHLLPRIYSMISELDFYYDDISEMYDKVFEGNLPLTIIEYVKHHFTEKITYRMISENFFVSKPTVIKIFKAYSGKTMHDYIEYLRLEAAANLIRDNVNVVTAAKMSGFEYYSTFLRAYKAEYGSLPVQNQIKERKYPKL